MMIMQTTVETQGYPNISVMLLDCMNITVFSQTGSGLINHGRLTKTRHAYISTIRHKQPYIFIQGVTWMCITSCLFETTSSLSQLKLIPTCVCCVTEQSSRASVILQGFHFMNIVRVLTWQHLRWVSRCTLKHSRQTHWLRRALLKSNVFIRKKWIRDSFWVSEGFKSLTQ